MQCFIVDLSDPSHPLCKSKIKSFCFFDADVHPGYLGKMLCARPH